MKRLCIYLTYDKQNIVDKYIGYMLKELNSCIDYLVVVCNERELNGGLDILEKYADKIFFRDNIGFDAGGFKDALCDYIGWEKVLQYDELVLVNDSMFGPFKPMKDIFAEMDTKSADFWGLTKHGEGINVELGYVCEHIQSYFLVVRTKMLHCCQFRGYWEEMPYCNTYMDTVRRHELRFTQYFSECGFTYAVLADTEINDSEHIENNYIQYSTISYELIEKRNFPFLKKQQIAYDTLDLQTQQNLRQALDYIDKVTDYDINLIWDNIIRTLNMADLYRSLHLQYAIRGEDRNGQFFCKAAQDTGGDNVAIIVFATYRDSVEYVLGYLQELIPYCQVRVFSESSEILEDYRKQAVDGSEVILSERNGLIAEFCDYDFLCVLQDVDLTSEEAPSCTGKSYFYSIWENLVKDTHHVSGILDLFKEEPRLGFLAPPQPNFAKYFREYGKGWDGRFEKAEHVVEELQLNCQLSALKAPYRVTDNFWIRGSILKKLKKIKNLDDTLLPYLWSYLAQDAGYYSGIVESARYASMNEVNMHYYLCQVASQVRRQYGNFHNFSEMKDMMLSGALEGFCAKYAKIFVYGAGDMAKKFRGRLPNIEAFVVSDGQTKPDRLEGIPVCYLSEIMAEDDCGIVLCLNVENQRQVIPLLKDYGINNFFCI